MTNAIAERMHTLKTDAAQGTRGLRLIPIMGVSQDEPPYRLLDANTLSFVKISEISSSGSVPELLVDNTLDVRVFLMDGQELVGAKQNRILNTDVLVPAMTKLNIPVSCVEAGRWNYNSKEFTLGKAASYSVRSGKQRRVHKNLKESGRHDAEQGEVWNEVSRSLAMADCSSPTSALHDAYAGRQQDLAEFRKSLKLPADAVGMAVFDRDKFCGLDIFDRHVTLQYFWDSLVDSYAIEWMMRKDDKNDPRQPESQEAVVKILNQAADANWETFRSPGEGEECRFATDTLAGSALVWDKQTVIHMQMFPSRPAEQDGPGAYRPRIHRRYGRGSGPGIDY